MQVTRTMVLLGCTLLVLSAMPLGAAHLAQGGHLEGSPTSFGFGGVADPDPCRRGGVPLNSDDYTGAPDANNHFIDADGACAPNNGVSGTYVHGFVVGLLNAPNTAIVECLDGTPGNGDCESVVFEPADFGATGAIFCDLEFLTGLGPDDEPHMDNGPHFGTPGNGEGTPEGTWDDGGTWGACHTSGYEDGAPPGVNTDPANPDSDPTTPPVPTSNNAQTVCTGVVFAEDWVLGDDVPIMPGCDSINSPADSPTADMINCILPPTDADCVVREIGEALSFAGDPTNPDTTCMIDTGGSAVDAVNLGKGGGHAKDGTDVPALLAGCPNGDVAVFVMQLVSANPFGDDVGGAPHTDHDFGWPGLDSTAEIPGSDTSGSGDTIVYLPTNGWIDHFY